MKMCDERFNSECNVRDAKTCYNCAYSSSIGSNQYVGCNHPLREEVEYVLKYRTCDEHK